MSFIKQMSSVKDIKCVICERVFTAKRNLYAHMRKQHELEVVIHRKKPVIGKFVCPECSKKFDYKQSFERHMRVLHKTENGDVYSKSNPNRSRLLCPQDDCNEKFPSYKSLWEHLSKIHLIKVEMETIEFNSIEDFQQWKTTMQQETLSFYARDTSPKILSKGVQRQYFSCSRSYAYRPKGKNLRRLKSLGSRKIGKACPARIEITVSTNAKDDKKHVNVNFWKTHCGHELELEHIHIDRDTRDKIAGKLMEGMSFDEIIHTIKKNECKEPVRNQRLLLLDRKDLHNIVRDYGIAYKCIKPISYDAEGLPLFIEETYSSPKHESPIYYEGQDEGLPLRTEETPPSLKYESIDYYEGQDEEQCRSFHSNSQIDRISPDDNLNNSDQDEEKIIFDICEENEICLEESFSDRIITKADCIIDLCSRVHITEESAMKLEKYLDVVISTLKKCEER